MVAMDPMSHGAAEFPVKDTGMLIVTEGVTLAAESFGKRDDPPIILVMGATASMVWWPDALCRRLAAAGRFVIRFDHRDTGRSSTVPLAQAEYGVEDMADDVLRVLDGYSITASHLVGMSLGGLIGQLLALRNPDRVLSLTLIAAEPLGGEAIDAPPIDPVFMAHFATMAALDWKDRDAVTAFLFEVARLSAAPHRGPDEAIVRQRISTELDRASDLSAAFNHATVNGDLSRWNLRAIAQPTLVIHGRHDPIVALKNGEAIARQIPDAGLLLLDEAGHELHSADLERISTAIVDHTGRAPGRCP